MRLVDLNVSIKLDNNENKDEKPYVVPKPAPNKGLIKKILIISIELYIRTVSELKSILPSNKIFTMLTNRII